MIIAVRAATALLVFCLLWTPAHALPGLDDHNTSTDTGANSGQGGIGLSVTQTKKADLLQKLGLRPVTPENETPRAPASLANTAGTGGIGDDVCIGGDIQSNGVPLNPDCGAPEEPEVEPEVEVAALQPQVTPGRVLTAFRNIPLPPSELVIQPPDGKTLVNFETNFYTENETFRRSVTLLGQRVDLDITPAAFTWRYGDGTQQTTSDPGAPYPDLQVTHEYQRKGVVSPSVDTTYSAVFRVNGDAWQPVPGVVTIEGEPQDLEVVTATPRLVGY